MTLNQMKYFIMSAECLSFTEAAKCLFLTQPALSRQIAAMEQELKTKLFVREKNGLKLTPGGSLLYNKLPEILKEYEQLVEQTRSANIGYEGTLHIGFLDVYDNNRYFTNVLRKFTENYPGIDLHMRRASTEELIEQVQKAELDLIVTYGFSLMDQPDMVVTNIHKFHSCLMLPKEHPLADRKRVSLSELKSEPVVMIHQKESEEGNRYIQYVFEKNNIYPETRIVDKMDDVLLWMELGKYIAFTTDVTIEKNNEAVRIIPIEGLEAHDMTIAWKKENYNPSISMFMELYEKENRRRCGG